MTSDAFDGRFLEPSFGPWKRKRPETYVRCCTSVNCFDEKFDCTIYPNMDLDLEVKRATIKASSSVVSLESVKDENDDDPFFGCGTIIDCKSSKGAYIGTILTSASLLRSSNDEPHENLIKKVQVSLADDTVYDGKVMFCDFHFNIAVLNIKSAKPLPTCVIRLLDDSISIDPNEIGEGVSKTYPLLPHSDSLFHLSPGDLVVAVGRYWDDHAIMAAPGQFSVDICNLDCKELFRADCKITKCGVGGPLINRHGEVIGINFYNELYTPFLPINVVFKCLDYFKAHGKFCRPRLGMSFTNLYVATVNKLETVVRTFPNIVKGIIVENVVGESEAHHAGILKDDIIFQCDGIRIKGVLEFLELIMYNVGKSVELGIARTSTGAQFQLSLFVEETTINEVNRWPLPQSRDVSVNKRRFYD